MPRRKRKKVAKAGVEYEAPPGCIRMDLNTNLLGPNPVAERAIKEKELKTFHYPGPQSVDLCRAIAKAIRMPADQIICGRGADNVIEMAVDAFAGPGKKIVTTRPSFVMYRFYARITKSKFVDIPLLPGFELDVDGLLNAKGAVTFIANPNNPTGNKFRDEDVLELLKKTKGVVALDEAYIEFSRGSFLKHIDDFDNLLIIRTFSKAYALAGLRVGYGVGSPEVIEAMYKVKAPFNVDVLGEVGAIAALEDRGWMKKVVSTIKRERKRLGKELEKLGFEVFPSEANFILARSPVNPTGLCEGLAERGVLIKDFSKVEGLDGCVRITVGGAKHTDLVLKLIREAL